MECLTQCYRLEVLCRILSTQTGQNDGFVARSQLHHGMPPTWNLQHWRLDSLCTEATGFSELFPGIGSTILTLAGQFDFPGATRSACECSRKSLKYLLKHPGKGILIGIVVGGAEGALDTAPGLHGLHILSQKGFFSYNTAPNSSHPTVSVKTTSTIKHIRTRVNDAPIPIARITEPPE